jgi:rhodanese-related sulfurtransferase
MHPVSRRHGTLLLEDAGEKFTRGFLKNNQPKLKEPNAVSQTREWRLTLSCPVNRRHPLRFGNCRKLFWVRQITAAVLLLAFWVFLPFNLPAAEWSSVAPAELEQLIREGKGTVVNCMSWLECMDSRIPDSHCLSGGPEDKKRGLFRLVPDRNRRVVFYCESENCWRSNRYIAEAWKAGYHQASILKGGFPAWKEAGFAVESIQRIPRVAQLSVRAKELKGWLDQDRHLTVLDVRDSEFYRENHIPGSINIPLEELHLRYSEIPLERLVVVVDNRGFRSFFTASYLKRKGLNAIRLFGGMQKWQAFFDKEWKPEKKR